MVIETDELLADEVIEEIKAQQKYLSSNYYGIIAGGTHHVSERSGTSGAS